MGFSKRPVARLSFRLPVFSRNSLASMRRAPPFHGYGGNRQLVRRQAKCLLGQRSLDSFHFKQNAPRLHHRHPHLGRALAFSHAGLKRLLGERLVGENANPYPAATLEIARKRDARRLDPTSAPPAAMRRATAPALLQFSIFDFFWFEHFLVSRCLRDSATRSSAHHRLLLLF